MGRFQYKANTVKDKQIEDKLKGQSLGIKEESTLKDEPMSQKDSFIKKIYSDEHLVSLMERPVKPSRKSDNVDNSGYNPERESPWAKKARELSIDLEPEIKKPKRQKAKQPKAKKHVINIDDNDLSDRQLMFEMLRSNIDKDKDKRINKKVIRQSIFSEFRFKESLYGIDDIDSKINDNDSDITFTPNLLGSRTKSSTDKDVHYLTSIFVDIDNASSYSEAMGRLAESGLPSPSIIIKSGREGGVHLYWVFKGYLHVKGNKSLSNKWLKLQRHFTMKLGGDPAIISLSNQLRLPGTINTKRSTYCEIVSIDKNKTFNFWELYNKHIPEEDVKSTESVDNKRENRSTHKRANSYPTYAVDDLLQLADIRGGIGEGYRNNFLLYLKGLKATGEVIHKYNLTHCYPPLPDDEVERIVGNNYDKGFTRSQTIVDGLDISPFEQDHMRVLKDSKVKEFIDGIDDYEITTSELSNYYFEFLKHTYILKSKKSSSDKATALNISESRVSQYKQADYLNLWVSDPVELKEYQRLLIEHKGDSTGLDKPRPVIESLMVSITDHEDALAALMDELIVLDGITVVARESLESRINKMIHLMSVLRDVISEPIYSSGRFKLKPLESQTIILMDEINKFKEHRETVERYYFINNAGDVY